MYSRSVFKAEPPSPIPKDYSGVAITNEKDEIQKAPRVNENPWQMDTDVPLGNTDTPEPRHDEAAQVFKKSGGSFLKELLAGKFDFKKAGGVGSFLDGIGTEEILIIAIALFLLFSKEGDRECAVMLLFLLIF